MSEDIKKINQTIAAFMLLSLALPNPAIADISNVMGTTPTSMPVDMYGVPVVKPETTIQPNNILPDRTNENALNEIIKTNK